MELRDYQTECVSRVVAAYQDNPHSHELIVLPCGAGKTIVFSTIIDSLARAYGLSALVVAHLDELLDQAADKMRMVKPDAVIGKVGSGVYGYGGEVTVAGIQTASKVNHLRSFKALYGTGNKLIIVLDESHLSAADSFQRLLAWFPDAFVLMVTATPYRLDGKRILNKLPLYTKPLLEMIQEHYLCDVRAIAIRTDISLDEIQSTKGDYNEHDLDLAINTPARNRRIVLGYLEHAAGKRGLAFGVTVSHAEALSYAFNEMGIPAATIHSKTPLIERKRLYKAFDAGDILMLTSVNVLSIGFDSPRAEVAILARPTQSQSLFVQQVGRVLRLAPGKKEALVLDITDNSMRMRIAPQTLSKALGKNIKDKETLLESEEREENEKAENEAQEKRALIRKLNDRRNRDMSIDLFALPEWEERPGGLFVLTIGSQKHKIALVPVPSAGWAQLYDVVGRLHPDFKGQSWATGQTLDGALQLAEKKAHLLLEGKVGWVDKNNSRRNEEITEGQKKMLKWYHIAWGEGTDILTKGQASDAIDAHKTKIDQRKAAKLARAAAKRERARA